MLIALFATLLVIGLWSAHSRRDDLAVEIMSANMRGHYPKPWWFQRLEQWFPDRCREIPEATDTSRILIRQFAIIKERMYLQQFASGENPAWMHSHPWKRGTVAIGLWGSVNDRHLGNELRTRRKFAPYFNYYGPTLIHQSTAPSPGHTSIFIGLGRKTDDKNYFPAVRKHWRAHILKLVKRI